MDYSPSQIGTLLTKLRDAQPLVHNITNTVSANICANIILCIGGLPVMADDIHEVEDIVRRSQAVVLNAGTLNPLKLEAMVLAGKTANRIGIPVVVDPVGAGASRARGQGILRLFDQVKPDIIRANVSEVAFLAGREGETRGVEAAREKTFSPVEVGLAVAGKYGTVVCLTGKKDYVISDRDIYTVGGGHSLMSKVTGMGCMLSSVTGAFSAVTEDPFLAGLAAAACFGAAGKKAGETSCGPGSFQVNFFDSLYALTPEYVESHCGIERIDLKF